MAMVKVTPEMIQQTLRDIDWAAIDAQTDEDIARNVANDPDAPPILETAVTPPPTSRSTDGS